MRTVYGIALLASLVAGACRGAEWDASGVSGDAAVVDRGEEIEPRYLVRFPEIPLARANTYAFALRGCPPAIAHVALEVEGRAAGDAIVAAAPELELTIAGARGTIVRFDGVFAASPGDEGRDRWTFTEIDRDLAVFHPAGVGPLELSPGDSYLLLLRVETSRPARADEPLRVRPTLVVAAHAR